MRTRIILAAVEEINLRGFKFTMGDLAKRLSISKSSLYEQFSSKDELIAAILDTVLNDFRAQETRIYQSDLTIVKKLQAVLTVTSQTFEPFHNRVYDDLRVTYPEEWKKVVDFRKERMNHLTGLLLRGMEDGSIRHVHIGVIQHILSSTDFTSYHFLTENNMTYPDAVAAMLDIMLHGILTGDKD